MSDGFDPFGAWTRFWMDSAAQAMQSWAPASGTTQSPEFLRKARADLMQTWSDWWEQWLRSPAFLDAQKQMLDGNLAMRKQFRTVLRRMQRDLQLAGREDIDALEAAIRRSERRILDRLDETSAQLRALEAKIDRLTRRRKSSADGENTADSTAANGSRRRRRTIEKDRAERE
jgi:hypothetical protein